MKAAKKQTVSHQVNDYTCNIMCCSDNAKQAMLMGNFAEAEHWLKRITEDAQSIARVASEIDKQQA